MFISRTRQSIGHRNGIILKTLFSSIQKNSVEKNRPISSLDQFFPSNIHPFFLYINMLYSSVIKKNINIWREKKIENRWSILFAQWIHVQSINRLMFLEKKKKIDKILGIQR